MKYLFLFVGLFVKVGAKNEVTLKPKCEERSVGCYYVGKYAEDHKLYYLPNCDFMEKQPFPFNQVYITSMSYDDVLRQLYFGPFFINLLDVDTNKFKLYYAENFVFNGIDRDYLTGNIYYVGYDFSIGVCNLDKRKCMPLIHGKECKIYRSDVILHPKRSQMFWNEGHGFDGESQFETLSLIMANMNGKNAKKIVSFEKSSKLLKTLDAANDLLYYAYDNFIYQVNLLTMEQKLFIETYVSSFYYMDCKLYCIGHNNIAYIYHLDGNNETIGFLNLPQLYMASELGHKATLNPCSVSNCGDNMCVLSDSNSFYGECLKGGETFDLRLSEYPNTEKPSFWNRSITEIFTTSFILGVTLGWLAFWYFDFL